jgi:hypothetical protein
LNGEGFEPFQQDLRRLGGPVDLALRHDEGHELQDQPALCRERLRWLFLHRQAQPVQAAYPVARGQRRKPFECRAVACEVGAACAVEAGRPAAGRRVREALPQKGAYQSHILAMLAARVEPGAGVAKAA